MLLACKGHIEAAHSKNLIVGCGRLWSSRHDFFYSIHFLPFIRSNQNIHPLFWNCLSLTVY
jgi:hypothetical protein